MEPLPPSLEDKNISESDFTMGANIFSLVFQLVERLEVLHELGVVHGDICPSSIHISLDSDLPEIKLSSFGLSSKYIEQNKHIKFSKVQFPDGRLGFASKNRLNLCV